MVRVWTYWFEHVKGLIKLEERQLDNLSMMAGGGGGKDARGVCG